MPALNSTPVKGLKSGKRKAKLKEFAVYVRLLLTGTKQAELTTKTLCSQKTIQTHRNQHRAPTSPIASKSRSSSAQILVLAAGAGTLPCYQEHFYSMQPWQKGVRRPRPRWGTAEPRAEGCWQESGVCGARGAASCAGVTAVTPSRSSPSEEEPLGYHPAAKNPRAPPQALTQADSGVP